MPDRALPGSEVFRRVTEMGVGGTSDRMAIGERLLCRCLFHGTSEADLRWVTVVPVVGGRNGWLGKPVVMPVVEVRCWPQCGYRVEWGRP